MAEASWDGTDHGDGVEDVVVEREVVGGDEVDPGVSHQRPPAGPDAASGGVDRGDRLLARPVALEGALQLPVGADPGDAVDAGAGHQRSAGGLHTTPGSYRKIPITNVYDHWKLVRHALELSSVAAWRPLLRAEGSPGTGGPGAEVPRA